MDLGLLLLRLLLGGLMIGHGAQKLFGTFGGSGLEGTGRFFERIGFRPGRPMAFIAGITQFVGGLFIVPGVLTPLAAAAVLGTLVVAATVHGGKGLWAQKGGYELAFVYSGLAAALALTGPGSWSVDRLLGLDSLPVWFGLAASALGLASGALVALRASALRRAEVTAVR